jgi:hypothetical protein
MQNRIYSLKFISLFCLLLGRNSALSLSEVKNDPLFEYKPPKKESLIAFVPKSVPSLENQKPTDRNLVLDFFKQPGEAEHEKKVISSVNKLIGLLKLADSFQNDENYSVTVNVTYKTDPDNSAHAESQAKAANAGSKARELALKPQRVSVRHQKIIPTPRSIHAVVDPEILEAQQKSRFEFPKHFF